MRFAFLLSGAAGFALVVLVGLGSGRDIDPVLRDAAVACVLCGFVGRWFWRGLESAFVQTLAARRAAAEAAEAESPPEPARASVSASVRAAASSSKPPASAKDSAPSAAPSRR